MFKLQKYKPYLANLILIWLVFFLYKTLPYYKNFLKSESLTTLFILSLTYTVIAFLYYLFIPKDKIKPTKGLIILKGIKRQIKGVYYCTKNFKDKKQKYPKVKGIEKVSFLFILVKIFFLPIMLNFFFSNWKAFIYQLPNLISENSLNIAIIPFFNNILFPFLLTAIFMIDTLWFSFGYTFESTLLSNKIKSVEPTILGWLVTLVCYPPFNGIITNKINWYADDYILFSTPLITFIMRIIIVFLLLIYVGATLALGTRCSNLTNRGIVSRGPYAIIRHPAYISKNLAWWLTIIPVISWPALIGMGAWSTIYHLRTLTEERHLSLDPDYIRYKEKVKYKYIPGIY